MSNQENKPKILVVGDFHAEHYEKAFYNAFVELGYAPVKFSWHQYFGQAPYLRDPSKLKRLTRLWSKVQYHYAFGPIIRKINHDLIKAVNEFKPDLVFIYRGTHILPQALKNIKKSGAIIFGYNNDDPFSSQYPKHFWRHFRNGIEFYDHLFAYRQKNIKDYQTIGFTSTSILRSYYIAKNNYHYDKLPSEKYICDVIFAGHFEADGRDEYLKLLLDQNVNLKISGSEWHLSKYYEYFKQQCGAIEQLDSENYNLALNSAKISLVFLSKLNNDTYTRRIFEITAAQSLMLAVYTDDLNSLFEKGKEADYFTKPADLLEKVNYYLANDMARSQIVTAACQRLLKDGHEVKDRARQVLETYKEIYEKDSSN